MRFGAVHHSLGDISVVEAMERVKESGGTVFSTSASPENRDLLADLSSEFGIELVAGWGDTYIENGSDQPTSGFEQFCREVCRPLGIRVVATCSSHHRWRQDPPLAEQLSRLGAALQELCKVASDYGVTIAVENHADYRADDLLQLLDRVDSPQLGIQLDTGNPYAVAEEPVEAAHKLAPYAVSTHIKDMSIRPLTDGEWVKVKPTAIGEGDVDIISIARILADKAPEDLPFMLEVESENPAADFPRSVEYVRENLQEHIEFA